MASVVESLDEEMVLTLSEKLKAWDANFRDMSAKLAELQSGLFELKTKQEPKTPVSPPTTQQETVQPSGHTQPIKLKDAIESVPVFDGYRPSVFHFLRACERARNMISRYQEPQLVKLLVNKLRGHALLAIEDTELTSLNDFGNKLKDLFGPKKSLNEYKGELGTIFQRPGEDILDYMDRVRNLRLAIMDGERGDYGIISPDIQDTIDWETKEAFVKGLPNEVYVRVKIAGYHTLEDAYRQAVKATHELKQITDRTRPQRPTPSNYYRRDNAHPSNTNNNIRNNRQDRRSLPPSQNFLNSTRQNITCNYCKKPGHLVKDCYKFKARVDAGLIVPYASRPSGNQTRPSGEWGEPRRNDTPNRPRVQAATRRPAPTATNRTRTATPARSTPPPITRDRANAMPTIRSNEQPLNIVGESSHNQTRSQTENPESQGKRKRVKHKQPAKENHQELNSDSEGDLSELFQ
ncbi:uncharacterized protein LOC126875855 [Bombus huntii]|uniref:uncharacterized protein LOC126875855 n=1 Tax=Bombus huntii TaxID=85661 RepID=UPI0021A9B153|nr:uncharacterized protein LOC126875855 [Bombus huntii]